MLEMQYAIMTLKWRQVEFKDQGLINVEVFTQ